MRFVPLRALITLAAAVLVAFGAATSAAKAAHEPCPGITTSVVAADGSSQVVCITLSVVDDKDSLSLDPAFQDELWSRVAPELGGRRSMLDFVSIDIAAIQARGMELGIDVNVSGASLSDALGVGIRGGEKKPADALNGPLAGIPGGDEWSLGQDRKAGLEGLFPQNPANAGSQAPSFGPMAEMAWYSDGPRSDAPTKGLTEWTNEYRPAEKPAYTPSADEPPAPAAKDPVEQAKAEHPVAAAVIETVVKSVQNTVRPANPAQDPPPPGSANSSGSGQTNDAQKKQEDPKAKAEKDAKDKAAAEAAKKEEEKKATEKEKKDKEKTDKEKTYSDPDSVGDSPAPSGNGGETKTTGGSGGNTGDKIATSNGSVQGSQNDVVNFQHWKDGAPIHTVDPSDPNAAEPPAVSSVGKPGSDGVTDPDPDNVGETAQLVVIGGATLETRNTLRDPAFAPGTDPTSQPGDITRQPNDNTHSV